MQAGGPVTSYFEVSSWKSWILQYECRFHFPTWDVGENVPTTSRRVEFTAMNGNAEDGALPLWNRYLDFLERCILYQGVLTCNLIYPKLLTWVARWVDWLVKNHRFAEWRCEDVRSCERQDRVVQCRSWGGSCEDYEDVLICEFGGSVSKEATLACSDSCHKYIAEHEKLHTFSSLFKRRCAGGQRRSSCQLCATIFYVGSN